MILFHFFFPPRQRIADDGNDRNRLVIVIYIVTHLGDVLRHIFETEHFIQSTTSPFPPPPVFRVFLTILGETRKVPNNVWERLFDGREKMISDVFETPMFVSNVSEAIFISSLNNLFRTKFMLLGAWLANFASCVPPFHYGLMVKLTFVRKNRYRAVIRPIRTF